MAEGIWYSIVSHQETNTRETMRPFTNHKDLLSKDKTIETAGGNINYTSEKQYR